jgi:hypothetical protein
MDQRIITPQQFTKLLSKVRATQGIVKRTPERILAQNRKIAALPARKAYMKAYYPLWREKNRESFNTYHREYYHRVLKGKING